MTCEMCLFHNPPDAEMCLQCRRMRFPKRKRPEPADADPIRWDGPKAETAFDMSETCIDWTAIRAEEVPG